MKRFDSSKIAVVSTGSCVLLLVCGGSAGADFTFGTPANLGAVVNSSFFDGHPEISADGRLLLFQSVQPGGSGGADIWQAPIIPIVDFNGDEAVDIKDLLILIESWGQNDPSADIGPTPLGDGVVHAADLEVLMGYWGEEASDPALMAH